MKRFISFMVLCMLTVPTMAATGRLGVNGVAAPGNRISPAKMASLSFKSVNATTAQNDKSSIRADDETATLPDVKEQEKDKREKERAACLQNNIGVGNTFVWASRYSNLNDYSTMIEDVENPENNACFVLVSLKSADSRIDLGDIRSQYYEMGRNITCGAWADESKIEKRILDAKKPGRTWATIGGAVGGAALGVTSMELFGNRLIGGAVEGQKTLEREGRTAELIRSQLLALKNSNPSGYNAFIAELGELRKACGNSTDDKCTEYSGLYDLIDGNN